MEEHILKQKVLQLVGDLNSDSKTKASKAEKEIIRICEPIIKQHWNIGDKYKVLSKMGWDDIYMPQRGKIVAVSYGIADHINFVYHDASMSELFECTVKMSIHWLDNDSLERYEKVCKGKRIVALEGMKEYHKKELEWIERELKELTENGD